MPKSISVDLRTRVMTAIDNKVGTLKEIAKRFAVGERTIYSWLKLRRSTNDIAPRVNYQKGHSHTISDWEEFGKFVANHTHLMSPAMCVEWEKIYGKPISRTVMKRGLKKIGYTFKKNSFAIGNPTRIKEQTFYRKSAK
jgi:transposase